MPAILFRILSAATPEVSDSELLGRFIASRDSESFEELLRRHGPAVWQICRRLVGISSADDAFQATFLILACRAESVRKAASVGSWLIGVAGRVARQQRKRERRYSPEKLERIPERATRTEGHDELAAVLDDELTRLPDRLRDPAVLCWLQGRTQADAAAELGGSVRTIRRRLDQAKSLLRLRLERRGIVPALAAALITGAGSTADAVHTELIHKTRTIALGGGANTPAAILAKGVVMGHSKLAAGGTIIAAAVLTIGISIGLADDPTKGLPAAQPDKMGLPIPTAPAPKTNDPNSSVFRSPNFLVLAPSPMVARILAAEAEHWRKELAMRWFGKELPNWTKPCVIRYSDDVTNSGSTSLQFRGSAFDSAETILKGSFTMFLATVDADLPKQVTHCVLATHFGKPVPRWADEGIAWRSEVFMLDKEIREFVGAGRAYRLKQLFKMTEYPKDPKVLSAQGQSVVKFLLAREPLEGSVLVPGSVQFEGAAARYSVDLGTRVSRPRRTEEALIEFIHLGAEGNSTESWNKAAKTVYGFDSVDDLESAWIEWLRKPEKAPVARPAPKLPDENSDRIPPTKLPGGR